ncbi:GPI anchored serine-threonine rich family protein [Streptomyces lydicamycinicus]|uniref:GPI anchored serine-threonine rich family protein n=1 Tax=Streptomyces lydicamycinicus TaxID=1546107 RepID=UPI0020350207|nr:GPI anchored serine-threonine rich family protein [Streptomyces lydicamycinicus]USA00242.1 GPI anchored serine-threonine rich family protein [Streptomyces lydicamycinicus]
MFGSPLPRGNEETMCRATSMATNLAVAVATTAVGCMLVISLAPSRPDTGKSGPAAGRAMAATAGHAGSAARAATSALGAPAASAGPEEFASPPTGRIEVTAPEPGVDYKANGSFAVTWNNSTGEEVDIWLRTATGHGESERVALVATKAGAGPSGEALVTLPRVPPGKRYFLEVATAGDGAVRAFSRTFAITN